MDKPDPTNTGLPAQGTATGEAAHLPPSQHPRPRPPMRVVVKGWWTLEEKQAGIEELKKEDRDERQQA